MLFILFKYSEMLWFHYKRNFDEFISSDQQTDNRMGMHKGHKDDGEKLSKEYFILIICNNIVIKLQKFITCLSFMRCLPKKSTCFVLNKKNEETYKINSIRRKVMKDLFH